VATNRHPEPPRQPAWSPAAAAAQAARTFRREERRWGGWGCLASSEGSGLGPTGNRLFGNDGGEPSVPVILVAGHPPGSVAGLRGGGGVGGQAARCGAGR